MRLSDREREVLTQLGRHRTNAEISGDLFISVRTVESHVSSLLRKLQLPDRRALAAHARATASGTPARPRVELVGRDALVARIGHELTTSRLVTLTGPGGVGKTSLARAAGGDAATFVDLAALLPAAPAEAVASTALAALAQEEVVGKGPVESLVAAARRAPLLLLLDNAEHVLDATAEVAAALLAGSDAVVLTTSRERLAVDGESVVPVPGLDPEAAAALFRARAGDGAASTEASDDDLVAWVCESVDGLPLAIELAAARTRVLPLRDLARALGHGVDVLEGGDRTRARHRSLAAAIGWSYDLLGPADQDVHRRLSVLPGRFGVADAGAVTGAGEAVAASLARLVEASLLVRDGLDGYRQLDLVRADAGRRLDAAGERTACEDRLLAWVATEHPDQERSVLLAAADVAARRTGDPAAGELLGRLAELWADEHAWTDAVSAAERGASVSGRADLAVWAAELAWSRWQGDDALRLFTLAGELAQATGDGSRRIRALVSRVELPVRFGAIVARPPDPAYLRKLMDDAEAVDDDQRVSSEGALLMGRTWAAVAAGDHVAAENLGRAAAAAAEAAGDWVVVSAALDAVMDSLALVGDVAAMSEVAERRFLLRHHLTGSARAEMELSDVLDMATDGPRFVGDFRLAEERAQLVLVRETARGLPYVGLGRLLLAEFFLGRWSQSLAHGEEMRQVWLDDGSPRAGYLAPAAMALAAIGGYRGDAELERSWSRLADELHEGSAGIAGRHPLRQALRADVARWTGRHEEAAALVTQEPATMSGPSRPLYAATRAEVLGGDAVREAEAFLGGSAYAAALLHRARGDLEAAERGFVACGAEFQVHRTRLLRAPADATARAALSALGVPAP